MSFEACRYVLNKIGSIFNGKESPSSAGQSKALDSRVKDEKYDQIKSSPDDDLLPETLQKSGPMVQQYGS
ncbi:hypothetical protein scyTo_0005981 [Scyliorhinus torazame]|uniref:Uncharacterized protein n=1 Tax=Scyliorhinus torazame TaxID=75743 RepID=A0A401PEK2_SCYTO|nr:hypothetical protein [Scyliorhinus torazame]